MYPAIFMIILIVIGSANAYPQQPPTGAVTPACSFFEIYRKDGWTVPGVHGAKEKIHRAAFHNIPGVFVTVLEPLDRESTITQIWCPHDHTGRIEIEDLPIKILDLWAFDYAGRVFAYGISYGNEAIEDGTRVQLGSASAVIFYDLDGSGRFSLRKGTNYPLMPDTIPDWVKDGAKATRGTMKGTTKRTAGTFPFV